MTRRPLGGCERRQPHRRAEKRTAQYKKRSWVGEHADDEHGRDPDEVIHLPCKRSASCAGARWSVSRTLK